MQPKELCDCYCTLRALRPVQIGTVEDEVDSLQNQVNTMEADKHKAAGEGSEVLSRMREEHVRKLKSIEDNNAQIESFIAELKKMHSAQES